MKRILVPVALLGLSAGLILAREDESIAEEHTPSAEASAPPRIRVAVDLSDGSHLIGVPSPDSFVLLTSYGRIKIPFQQGAVVRLAEDHETATVEMPNGDRLKGSLSLDSLKLRAIFGNVSVDMQHVTRLTILGPDAVAAKGLVFWNTLGSEWEALHSRVGPGLKPFVDGVWPEVAGQQDFVPDEHGGALTLKGSNPNLSRVRNLVLNGLDKLIDPERGAIEFWYCQKESPLAYSHGYYRMVDGPYGLNKEIGFFACRGWGITFSLSTGAAMRTVACPIEVMGTNQWVHLAACWDRQGIERSSDTIRLYVNGEAVSASQQSDWCKIIGGQADIGGAQDNNCAGKFLMSDLKIWNWPKTEYGVQRVPQTKRAGEQRSRRPIGR